MEDATRGGDMSGSGDPRVDEALGRLGELAARPVPEHVEVFEDVHRTLQEVLGSIDQEGAP